MMKRGDIKKICFIIITPPLVEFVGVEKIRFEGEWAKFRLPIISGYFPSVGRLCVDGIVKKKGIFSCIEGFEEDLNQTKLSCDKMWLVCYQGNLTF